MKCIVTIIFCSTVLFGYGQKDDKLLVEGNKLYKQKEYGKAMEAYGKVAEKNPANVKARYNLGNALYRSKQVENAEKTFEGLAENTTEKPLKAQAFYNKGVAQSQQKKLPESIDAYKQALRIAPNDEEARENLQKALNELKKQHEQQSSQNNQQDNKKDEQEKPEKNKSKLNKKQAEKMLDNLRQEEKNIQKDLQKTRNQSSRTPEKDW